MDIMQSPPFSFHPRLEGYNRRKAVAPPPVCVDIYVSETDERTRRDPLPPQTNREKALQQKKTQNVDGEWPREEEREETCCSSRYTDSQPTVSGLQGEYKSHPGRKRAANASRKSKNDAVNCFLLFFFFFFD